MKQIRKELKNIDKDKEGIRKERFGRNVSKYIRTNRRNNMGQIRMELQNMEKDRRACG